eukprot:30969-Pelagococcus_subviridis.AAC.7
MERPTVWLRREHDVGADASEQRHREQRRDVPRAVASHDGDVPPGLSRVPGGEGGRAQASAERGRDLGRVGDDEDGTSRDPRARVQSHGDAASRGVQGGSPGEASGAVVRARAGGTTIGVDDGGGRRGGEEEGPGEEKVRLLYDVRAPRDKASLPPQARPSSLRRAVQRLLQTPRLRRGADPVRPSKSPGRRRRRLRASRRRARALSRRRRRLRLFPLLAAGRLFLRGDPLPARRSEEPHLRGVPRELSDQDVLRVPVLVLHEVLRAALFELCHRAVKPFVLERPPHAHFPPDDRRAAALSQKLLDPLDVLLRGRRVSSLLFLPREPLASELLRPPMFRRLPRDESCALRRLMHDPLPVPARDAALLSKVRLDPARGDGAHLLRARLRPVLPRRSFAARARERAHGRIRRRRLLPRDDRRGAAFHVLRPLRKLRVKPHVPAVHDHLQRVRYDVRLARLSDDVLHPSLHVGADEVMLRRVHVRHRGVLQVSRELPPRGQRRSEVLPDVQAPYPLQLEHLRELRELLVEEAVFEVLNVQRLHLRVLLERVEDGVQHARTRVGLDEALQAEDLPARVAV